MALKDRRVRFRIADVDHPRPEDLVTQLAHLFTQVELKGRERAPPIAEPSMASTSRSSSMKGTTS